MQKNSRKIANLRYIKGKQAGRTYHTQHKVQPHTPASPNIIYIIPNNNMATRGAFGLTHKGQTKMIYNHYDSYPEGLGRDFVDWIKNKSDDELKRAFNNIKLGRCDNYGIEKFINTRAEPQTWDRVTQEEIDEGYAIEYSYNYDIDNHTLITTGEEHDGLQDLEDEIQEDRQARAGLTHKDTIDRYDYQGKVLKITRTENKTIVEYNGQKKTENRYMTAIEATELITKG